MRGRKPAPATSVHRQAAEALKAAKAELGTWRSVARKYNINHGLASRVASGAAKAPPAVLAALDLLPKTADAPVCPVHGVVHLLPGCPDEFIVRRRARKRVNPQYIRDWPVARLRWAFDHREVMP